MKIKSDWTDLPVEPCVGCGYCCMKTTCWIGMLRLDAYGPNCPGLVWDEAAGRYWCKLMLDEPASTRADLMAQVAVGAGCSSSLFNDQRTACIKGRLQAYLSHQPK